MRTATIAGRPALLVDGLAVDIKQANDALFPRPPKPCTRAGANSAPGPRGVRPVRGERGDGRRRLRTSPRPRRRARTTEVVRALLKQLGELPDQRKAINYLMILVTWPAPTVRPPSRMANFRPSSMATGWISSTRISVLSPGMTISVPSGRFTTPVTSVVRK